MFDFNKLSYNQVIALHKLLIFLRLIGVIGLAKTSVARYDDNGTYSVSIYAIDKTYKGKRTEEEALTIKLLEAFDSCTRQTE